MDSLLAKLALLLGKEKGKLTSIISDVMFLRRELVAIHAFLLNAADSEGELDPQLKDFTSQFREIASKIGDWIDEVMHHHRVQSGTKAASMHETTARLNASRAQRQIENKVTLLKHRLVDLGERRSRYSKHGHGYSALRSKTVHDERKLMLCTSSDGLIGVDGPVEELSNLLMTGPEHTKLKVVSIAGLAGLGKSTLAHAVYRCLSGQFQCGAFTVVTRKLGISSVLMSILSQLEPGEDRYHLGEDTTSITHAIRDFLVDKRYIIVIDDVRSVEDWEIIKLALCGYNHGSRILVTTSVNSIAEACCCGDDGFMYNIKPLSDPDSKKLLLQRLFGTKGTCPPPLTEACNEILSMCGGMPLAIICIASMLSCQAITKQSCKEVVNSLRSGSIASAEMEYLREILSLSYYDLTLHPKSCLLYLSIFPENHMIKRVRLVKKWIAEGLVSQEQDADQYFADLINRNIIQPVECNIIGEVITYRVHPMMHLLLKFKAEQGEFAALLHSKDISTSHGMNFSRLSIHCPDSENPIDSSSMAFTNCRSLTVFGHANRSLLMNFEGMWVLDLEGCMSIEKADLQHICRMVLLKQLVLRKTQITELPPEIGNLKHLERLDVGLTQITKLPPEIGNLYCLERLDARKSQVKALPNEVARLRNLVHLLIGDNDSSEGLELPDAFWKLTSLKKLCTIDLKKCSKSSLKELGSKLMQLEELAVVSSDDPGDTSTNDILMSSLEESKNLHSLVVYSDFSLSTLKPSSPYTHLKCQKKLTVLRRSLNVPNVIAGESFCGVKELDIRVCQLEENGLKILRELPRLHSFTVRLEILPRKMVHISHEGFACLESFCVDSRMPRVIIEEGAMPKLKRLELKFYAGSASEEPMGIKHLLNLERVLLRYSLRYASNKGVKGTVAAMKTEAEEHRNHITLCIAEENKDGSCTEIIEERTAKCSMKFQIEGDEERRVDGTCPIQKTTLVAVVEPTGS